MDTNRQGVYVAHAPEHARNIALKVTELFESCFNEVDAGKISVDSERCILCLTCYRVCPHGAVSWNNDAAVMSPLACFGCGICASECPMDAIELSAFSDTDLFRAVSVEKKSHGYPLIVAFCCENSALEAFRTARTMGAGLPEGLTVVHVPCAGKIDAAFIWKALAGGADGVIVSACHEGNCKSERGNAYARWRVNEIAGRLEDMGVDRERVAFVTLASNMGDAFEKMVNGFADRFAD